MSLDDILASLSEIPTPPPTTTTTIHTYKKQTSPPMVDDGEFNSSLSSFLSQLWEERNRVSSSSSPSIIQQQQQKQQQQHQQHQMMLKRQQQQDEDDDHSLVSFSDNEVEDTNDYGILGSKSLPNLSLVQDNAKPHAYSLELIRRQSSMDYSSVERPTVPTRKDDNETPKNSNTSDASDISSEREEEQAEEEREERCINIRVLQRRPCRWSSSSSSSTTQNQSSLSSSTKKHTNIIGCTSDYLPKYPERRYPDRDMFVSSFDTTGAPVGRKQNKIQEHHIESVLNVLTSKDESCLGTEEQETS
jgi:hypothetical protein